MDLAIKELQDKFTDGSLATLLTDSTTKGESRRLDISQDEAKLKAAIGGGVSGGAVFLAGVAGCIYACCCSENGPGPFFDCITGTFGCIANAFEGIGNAVGGIGNALAGLVGGGAPNIGAIAPRVGGDTVVDLESGIRQAATAAGAIAQHSHVATQGVLQHNQHLAHQ